MAEDEAAEDEGGDGIGGDDEEIGGIGPAEREQAVAVAADEIGERVGAEQEAQTVRIVAFVDEDGRGPEPEGEDDAEDLGAVAEVDLEAGDDPSNADGEEADEDHVDREQEHPEAEVSEPEADDGEDEREGEEVVEERGEEYRDGHDFGGENGFGDEVGIFKERRGGAGDRFLEKQPGEKAAKEPEGVVVCDLGFGGWSVEAPLENEGPTEEKDEGLDEAPEPAGGRANEALGEIAADEFDNEGAAMDDVAEEQRAG